MKSMSGFPKTGAHNTEGLNKHLLMLSKAL